MKPFLPLLPLLCAMAGATTIQVVPVYEPLSLHGADHDEITSEVGEALQACVMSRPMALTGNFPETLVESIRSPHAIPSNNPNYKTKEANLLLLCGINLKAELTKEGLVIHLQCAQIQIPPEVDLTSRQILRLTLVAIRKTLEDYQKIQSDTLRVHILIESNAETQAYLNPLATTYQLPGGLVK